MLLCSRFLQSKKIILPFILPDFSANNLFPLWQSFYLLCKIPFLIPRLVLYITMAFLKEYPSFFIP
jgi:hypothetical protein